jgi:iron complex outermembrane receptor protein
MESQQMSSTFRVVMAVLAISLACSGSPTRAADDAKTYRIAAQDLETALLEFALQSRRAILFSHAAVANQRTTGVTGRLTVSAALHRLIADAGVTSVVPPSGPILIRPANVTLVAVSFADSVASGVFDAGPQSGSRSGQTDDVDRATALEEIVVTAQRRAENLDKVPISITALPQRALDELHIQTFSDLASIVPGLDSPPPVPASQGGSDIAIRGIFSGGNAPTTAIYIDETPIAVRELSGAGPAGSFHPDIFDLDRIEVLRGPQGTLFGSSAMGGAIRFITPQPSLTDTSGYAKAELAYTDRGDPSYAAGIAYGAPISTGLAGFRVSGWFHSDGGFIDIEDPFTGQIVKRNANALSAYTIRPALTIAPTDGLTITPSVFIQHQHSDAPSSYWRTLIPQPEPGALTAGALIPQPLVDNITVASLAVRQEFLGMTLQSDSSYLDRWFSNVDDTSRFIEGLLDGGQPFIPGVPNSFASAAEQRGGTKSWQQQVRLTSPDTGSRWHWVAGAYYRHAQETLSQTLYPDLTPITEAVAGQTSDQYFGVPNYALNGQVLNSYTWFRAVDEQKAAFGEVSVDITQRLKGTIGLRVEHSTVIGQHEIVAGPLNGVTFSDVVLPDQVQNPVTPRVGIVYQYTDRDMVYVTAAKGYRAGGSNSATSIGNPLCGPSLNALGLTSVPASFNSDSLWSYEVGAKDSLLDGRLVIQTSIFYINWTNIQTAITLPSCSEIFTANQGKAVSRGFDLQVAWVPLNGVKLSANAGYTDAFYPNGAFGAPVGGVPPLLNQEGDKLPQVIPWTAAAHAEFTWDVGRIWSGARSYVRADYRWLDAMPKANPNVANYDPGVGRFPNQAYGILNFRLGVLQRGGLDVSAFVNNATNSHPLLSYTHYIPGDPLYYAQAIPPLTAGLTALYRF